MAIASRLTCDQCGKEMDGVDRRQSIMVQIGEFAGVPEGSSVKIQSAPIQAAALLHFCSAGCLRQYLVKVSP